jgi:microcystin degradation protein MlrC
MRIAIAGIATENSTFSVSTTALEDFTILRGGEMLPRYPFLLQFDDVTFVPLIRARALPGGPVDSSAYQQIKAELIDQLGGQTWDGVYLDMHGAMYVRGLDDAEGDWMASVREVVGESCLIAASYDLHGNVSQRVMDNVDVLTAFRTAPHVDVEATLERAVQLLVGCLRNGIRPVKRFIPVPVLLPGEKTSTEWEPGQSLYARIPQAVKRDGVLDASILIGYAWADEPRSSACVVVLGTDEATVDDEARSLAQHFWDVRREFQFGVPAGETDEIIQMALDAPESCVFISDSGDNPTAGGVGDVTYTLGRLIDLDVQSAVYASIPDAEAVEACHRAGVGAEVDLLVGGKLDTRYSQPLAIRGKVIAAESFPRVEYGHTGPMNKQAVIQVGGVKAILTEYRTPFHFIAQFERLGIDTLAHKLVVIKIGYLEPDLKRAAPLSLLALSPGAVNQALSELPYERITRPIFPFDPDMDFLI